MTAADEQQSPPRASGDELTPGSLSPGVGERERASSEPPISPARWQDLEARWKAILGLEAAIDTVRTSMEGLLAEVERLTKTPLSIEEKTYALRADVAHWEQAKKRVHFAVPKMKEFIHRAIWALGSPERKRLQEIYKDHIQPQIAFPRIDEMLKQLEELQKDHQILAALGKTVYQEARGISADVQGALKSLQNNADARKRKGPTGSKRGFFK